VHRVLARAVERIVLGREPVAEVVLLALTAIELA